jgi:hypothetical protein
MDPDESPMTGAEKLAHFIRKMELHTPDIILKKATWMNVRRSPREPAEAFALRFEKAALMSGRPLSDINARFAALVVEPWAQDPTLSVHMTTFEAEHRREIVDDEELHITAMAVDAQQYETLYVTKLATRMEQSGQWTLQ